MVNREATPMTPVSELRGEKEIFSNLSKNREGLDAVPPEIQMSLQQIREKFESAHGLAILHALPDEFLPTAISVFSKSEDERVQEWFSNSRRLLMMLAEHKVAGSDPAEFEIITQWETLVINLRKLMRGRQTPAAEAVILEFATSWTERVGLAREFVDKRIQEVLIQYAGRVNEGENGVILRLSVDEVPEGLRKELGENGADLGSAERSAVKLIKIYNKGKAAQEFARQRQAHRIAEEAAVKGIPMAKVPRPYFTHELHVAEQYGSDGQSSNKQDIDRLIELGFPHSVERDESGREVRTVDGEMIVMDYLEGKDLATIMYQWILTHVPQNEAHLVPSTATQDFGQLSSAVFRVLNLQTPRPDEFDRIHYNDKAIFARLKQTGFSVSPELLEQITNLDKQFDANGFPCGDAHERNIVIEGSLEDVIGQGEGSAQAYIIDYGLAYEDVPRGYDEVVGALRALHKPASQELA